MRSFLLLLALLGIGLPAYAQMESPELWSGYTLKYTIHKSLRAEAEQQFRTGDGLQNLRAAFLEGGLRYEITDYLHIKPQLRYTIRNKDRNEFRMSLDANLSWNFKKWNLRPGYRFRFQNTTVNYTGQNLTLLRNQLELEYNLSKLVDPYLEYENFYRLNDKNEVRTHRYTLGAKWRLNKHTDLKTYLRRDNEVNVKDPEEENIIGMELSFDL